MQIDAPGFHPNMSHEDYHADPCPEVSLSAGGAQTLVTKTPMHYLHTNRRLNPDAPEESNDIMSFGSVVHEIMLGDGSGFDVCDFKDWRTNDAKAAKADAVASGRTAILKKDHDAALVCVKVAMIQLDNHGIGDVFSWGHNEASYFWQKDGVWNRARADNIDPDRRVIYDLKTCHNSDPEEWVRTNMVNGIDLRAAHYLEGAGAVFGTEGWEYRFVLVESKAPFVLSVCRLPASAIIMGAKKIARARAMLGYCLEAEGWPGWQNGIAEVAPPMFWETKWLAREERDAELARRGGDALAYAIKASKEPEPVEEFEE